MDGLLLIDKSAGMTSHDVVSRVRRILRQKRVGHTGTLDPFATGVLLVLLGRATRLAQFMSGAEKEYEAIVRLGYSTDTGDLTGRRRERAGEGGATGGDGSWSNEGRWSNNEETRRWSVAEVEAALAGLRGEREQVPPMYSAKKVGGRKLYELARRGEEVERRAARITIHRLELLDQSGEGPLLYNNDGTCDVALRVVCSAGTYVRVLAEEIGERLGAGAHLASLRRTRAGSFDISMASTLDQLERTDAEEALSRSLISTAAALPELPGLHLTAEDEARARHGMMVRVGPEIPASWTKDGPVRLLSGAGELIAVGSYDERLRAVRPRVVIKTEE